MGIQCEYILPILMNQVTTKVPRFPPILLLQRPSQVCRYRILLVDHCWWVAHPWKCRNKKCWRDEFCVLLHLNYCFHILEIIALNYLPIQSGFAVEYVILVIYINQSTSSWRPFDESNKEMTLVIIWWCRIKTTRF